MLTEEELNKLIQWNNTPLKKRKYTKEIATLFLKKIFKPYENPTKRMTLEEEIEYNKNNNKETKYPSPYTFLK
jgi:hypothetical protein